MNSVQLFGNLGADPELRATQSGTSILKLRIATNERVKKGDKWEDHTEWHSVVMFGARCDWLGEHLSKGSRVLVQGKLRTSSYDDKDGIKRYKTEILADDIELGGERPARPGQRDEQHDADESPRPPRQQQRQSRRGREYGPDAEPASTRHAPADEEGDDDPLPF